MNKQVSIKLIFGILGLLMVYHLLIITQVIPFDKVWAGRLKSVEEMRSFESFSLLVLSVMAVVFGLKYRQLKRQTENRVINFLIWIFAVFFALNSIGNLFAESRLEMILGTAVTLFLSVLCFFIVRKNQHDIWSKQ